MGLTKKNISLSQEHKALGEKINSALKKVTEKVIAEAKATNTYLVIADEKGNVKKMPAKDL